MDLNRLLQSASAKINGLVQSFSQPKVQHNPVVQGLVNTAMRASGPIGSAISNNNSFSNAFTQVPKIDLMSYVQKQNPVVKFGAGVGESILNSPRNTAVGIQGLNKNVSDIYTKGVVQPQNIAANFGRAMDLPLNLMGGSLVKGTLKATAEQGFKQLGKQGLWAATKAAAIEGGKLGTGFGLSTGFQSGEAITNPLEYFQNLAMNTATGATSGFVLGGVGGAAGYGIKQGLTKLGTQQTKLALESFHNDIKSGTVLNSQNPVYQKYSKALGINSKTENTILLATQRLSKKMDDPSAEFVLERSKVLLPPEFKDLPTPDIAKVWSHIIARKNNRAIPGEIPFYTKDLDNAIFSNFKQGGKINLGAKVGNPNVAQPPLYDIGTYYIRNGANELVKAENAKPINLGNNVEAFSHRFGKDTGVVISEAKTGMQIATGKTEKEAIANAQKAFKDLRGITPQQLIERQLKSLVRVGESDPKLTSVPSSEMSPDLLSRKIIPQKSGIIKETDGGIGRRIVGDLNTDKEAIPHKEVNRFGSRRIMQGANPSSVKSRLSQERAKIDQLSGDGALPLGGSNYPSSPLPQGKPPLYDIGKTSLSDFKQNVYSAANGSGNKLYEDIYYKVISKPENAQKTIEQIYKELKSGRVSQPPVTDIMGKIKSTPGLSTKPSSGGSIPQGKVEQVFKTEKFNVGKKEVGIIKNLQKQMGLESRDVRTFDEMRAMAEEMGTSPKQLLKEIQTGRLTDKEVIALGNSISTSSQRINTISKLLKKNPGNEKLTAQLDAEEHLINQAIRKRIKGGTEAGRAVAAFRAIANKNLDPSYWLDKAQRQIGDKKELNADVITAVNEYIKNKDRLGLASFISKLGESSGLEKAVGFWKASLLTGLRTHEANIVGNTAMGGLETIKDIPATGFDMVRAAITRTPRTKSFGVGSVTDQFKGAVEGMGRAREVLKTGIDPQDIAKAEFNKPLRYGNTPVGKAAQKITNVVFRTLGAEDKVFYGAAYRRSMGEQMRLAKINKIPLKKGSTEEMIKIATKDALYSTFTNENALNNAIKGAKQAGGKEVAAAIDLIAPFTRTPTNVAKATFLDYTPVGFVAKTAQKIFKKESVDDKALAEAFGRSLTGTGALWLGTELAKRGLVSGASSNKETERSQAELEGKIPNSVFINGAWQSISKISPLGNLILLGAQYQNSGGNLPETAFAAVKGFSENSFLQGLSNAGKALNEPDRFASSFFENAAAGYIPTLASDVARGLDNVKRKPEGLVEKIQARIPGLRQALPARLNAKGEPVPEQGNFISKIANPFNSSTPTDDPIVKEMSRVGYNLNYTGDTISIDGIDTKLNRDQEREYQKLAGKYIKQYLPEFINSGGYTTLSKDDQRDVMEKLVNTAKTQAREELKTKLNTIKSDGGMKAGAAGFEDTNTVPGITFTSGGNSVTPSLGADKIIYRDGTSLKTIDLSPPTKGEGIGAFINQDWNITKAREVWNSSASEEQKTQAFEKLGVDRQDVRYDALANYTNDIKTQYLESKSKDHDTLIKNILTGRVESVSGSLFAADGVIDNLKNKGLLTADEAKAIKKIKTDKKGNSLNKATTGKGKKVKMPTLKAAQINLKKSASKKVKLNTAPKLKVQNINFNTPFSNNSTNVPLPKYRVKFNV